MTKTVLLLVGLCVLGSALALPLRAAIVPRAANGPYARVYYPQNQPQPATARAFPQLWTQAYSNARRNAAFTVGAQAPSWMRRGVRWRFAEARAWPLLRREPFGVHVYGPRLALATMTQFYGNALGVSAVDGVIYAESDDQFAYAINARTGTLIWRTSPVGNTFMGNPLVAGNRVYLSVGSVGFNYSNVQRYASKTAARGAGMSFNGIYTLSRTSGRLLWHFGTIGETMPTPALDHNRLFLTTGAGDIYAINATTGHQLWIDRVGGIANMSAPAVYHGHVYVAMAVVPYIYCLSARNGHIVWRGTIPHTTKSGFGDVPPAVDHNVTIMDAVAKVRSHGGRTTMTTIVRAFNAENGRVLWTHRMGLGFKPPAFKGGVPMIHKDVVYIGTPVNSVYQAYGLHTGTRLWTWHIPSPGPAGAGRGPPTYYRGKLFIAAGPRLFVLDPRTGHVLGEKYLGGRFGIVNPVIVGNTIYLTNSWDWILAEPVSAVVGHHRHARGVSP
ncbi:MAG: outer membrane protein assembly factor BamB family protein [Acidiferrobacter sp.]